MLVNIEDLIRSYEAHEADNDNPQLRAFIHELRFVMGMDKESLTEDSHFVFTNTFNLDPVTPAPQPQDRLTLRERRNQRMMEAFSNNVILKEICNNLSLSELLNFRLVNREWKSASDIVIRNKNLWKHRLNKLSVLEKAENSKLVNPLRECTEIFRKFVCTSVTLNMDFSLDPNRERDLSYIFAHANFSPEQEPSRLIKLVSETQVRDFYMFKFLKEYGSHIKVFGIACKELKRMRTVYNLFLSQLPNVQHLKLAIASEVSPEQPLPFGDHRGQDPLIFSDFKLPSLKTITYTVLTKGLCHNVIYYLFEKLLETALNLVEIHNFQLWMARPIHEKVKMHCVKKSNIYVPNPSSAIEFWNFDVDALGRLASARPQLETLIIHTPIHETVLAVESALSRILNCCRHSLKKLLLPGNSFFQGVELPSTFPNIEFLWVINAYLGTSKRGLTLFPSGYTLGQSCPFPKLRSLLLTLTDLRLETMLDALEDGFDDDEVTPLTFPNVSVLEFMVQTEVFDESIEPLLASKFPLVTKVVFTTYAMNINQKVINASISCLPKCVEFVEYRNIGLCLEKVVVNGECLWVYRSNSCSQSEPLPEWWH